MQVKKIYTPFQELKLYIQIVLANIPSLKRLTKKRNLAATSIWCALQSFLLRYCDHHNFYFASFINKTCGTNSDSVVPIQMY